MKVIFLDIDGVLCTENDRFDEFGDLFKEEFCDNLKMIIDQTNAEIVISSAWRYGKDGLERLRNMWKHRELAGDILNITPVMGTARVLRGKEIQYFLDTFEFQSYCSQEITSYVILDDDNDMLPEQLPFFVQCSNEDFTEFGLTKERANRAIQILNAND